MIPIMLMAMLNDDEKSKVSQIYDKYYGLMIYTANKVLNDVTLSEDAVSDSIEKIISNVDKIGDISCYKTRAYIVTIVRRTAIDVWRKKRRTKVGIDDNDYDGISDTSNSSFIDEIVSAETFQAIKHAIQSLPESLKEAAMLSIVHELDNQEIADILNISNSAVRMRISRAKKIIRDGLAGVMSV